MKVIFILGALFFIGLICIFSFGAGDIQKLKATVQKDFAKRHPDYEFIDCYVGEGDLGVAYVHVRFKTPGNDNIQEEEWQYWDIDSVWLHRDKYLKLTKKRPD